MQKTMYQVSSELPGFYWRYYKKKHFGLFFGHIVYFRYRNIPTLHQAEWSSGFK